MLGNLSFLLLGLCSLQGPDAGTTVFAISRAPYGTNGSRLIALFNWLTQIGFETEGIILIVGAALVLGAKAGFDPGTPFKVVVILVAVAMQAVLPFLGHATMVKVLRYLILPFVRPLRGPGGDRRRPRPLERRRTRAGVADLHGRAWPSPSR